MNDDDRDPLPFSWSIGIGIFWLGCLIVFCFLAVTIAEELV